MRRASGSSSSSNWISCGYACSKVAAKTAAHATSSGYRGFSSTYKLGANMFSVLKKTRKSRVGASFAVTDHREPSYVFWLFSGTER